MRIINLIRNLIGDEEVNKAMADKPTKKKITQHLFRKDRREDKEKEGWKFIKENGKGDLVLMEK